MWVRLDTYLLARRSQVFMFAESDAFEFSSILGPVVLIWHTNKQLVVIPQAESSSIAVWLLLH